jgi:hypothetical protein
MLYTKLMWICWGIRLLWLPVPVCQDEVSGGEPLSRMLRLALVRSPITVYAQRGYQVVGHHLERHSLFTAATRPRSFPHFENNVLVAVTEGAAEGVRRVGGAGPVQHHRSLAGRQLFADVVPVAVGVDVGPVQRQLELAPHVDVEVVMARVVSVQNQFFN